MPEYKPLVIEVEPKSVPAGVQTKWQDFTAHMPIFTRDIITPAISLESGNVGAIVSGVPTAYARANLFNLAMNYGRGNNETALNLNAYYEQLAAEWRGFIACIALDHQRIEVERVRLAYSDGKDFKETANIYEPKGAFGNMLFDRKLLWSDLEAQGAERGVPFIDVIKYDGKVVGATSPDSLLFTSVSYKVQASKERPFVDFNTGRFIDPLKNDMVAHQTLSLYAYVRHLIENLDKLAKYYEGLKSPLGRDLQPNYSNLVSVLDAWSGEIARYAAARGYKLEAAAIPQVETFLKPFSLVFNFKDQLYGINGTIVTEYRDKAIEFNPKELLLPSDSEIARLIVQGAMQDGVDRTSKLPVYIMPAIKKDRNGAMTGTAYFSLPLSTLGINVFGDNIGALVGQADMGSAIKSKMTAVYFEDSERNNLEVKLTLQIEDGTTREIPVVYTVNGVIRNADIIIWPNFISKHWNRYFVYSELPHYTFSHDFPFRAVPFVGDKDNEFRIITNDDNEPWYLAKGNQPQTNETKHVRASLHIESNDKTAGNGYKYEIYESNQPIRGLKLSTSNDKHAGFLIVRYDTGNNPDYPQVIADEPRTPVRVGADFGSTNTSIAFFGDAMNEPDGITFKNRRVALLSINGDEEMVADEKNLLFFQSNSIRSNSIKSVLTLHDPNRLGGMESSTLLTTEQKKAVKGGFPCFSNNLPVGAVSAHSIQLNCARCGAVNQAYNLKWRTEPIDKAYQTAYLSSLMLHVYAELYMRHDRCYPETIIWSYPSAMGKSQLNHWQDVWKEMENPDFNPYTDKTRFALTVSTFKIGGMTAGGPKPGPNLGMPKPGGGFGGPMGGGSFGGGGFGGGSLLSQMSGGPQQQQTGFGGNSLLNGALNQQQQQNSQSGPDLRIDNDNEPITFDPVKMVDAHDRKYHCLTEACAVANFLTSTTKINVNDRNTLTVCFDIGGSTTDISALTPLNTSEGLQLTMIKQSSIRFAAQRVSMATKYSPNFHRVLLETCDNFGLRIQGLNLMESRFSPDTAAYYFEQIVDRLDVSQLPFFYRRIASSCRDMLCVDLYVTGLILFYAGMIVKKLVKQVRNSKECAWIQMNGQPAKPNVNIVFAGKGARIMEWLGISSSDELSMQYYLGMFVLGMGGEQEAANYLPGYPTIVFPEKGSLDVKFEVSKGLTIKNSTLMRPKNEVPIEIIGESGYSIADAQGNMTPVDFDNSITPDMIQYIGSYFYGDAVAGEKFQQFCQFYYNVASQFFDIPMPWNEFETGMRNMNLTTYIQNMPEVRAAKQNQEFDFVAPLIILEGMKFYDEYLLKGVCQK